MGEGVAGPSTVRMICKKRSFKFVLRRQDTIIDVFHSMEMLYSSNIYSCVEHNLMESSQELEMVSRE